MAERVVLHVGLMKSGTSHLQSRLVDAPDRLAAAGFVFPGPTWSDHVDAVREVLGRRRADEAPGRWSRMVSEIDRFPGTAIISMEFLAAAGVDRVRDVVDSFRGTALDVVVTVRDLGRAIPSMWQESVKNGRTWPWGEYVDGVRHHRGPGEDFWREQDAVAVTAKWSDVVGADHVTVVTLPRPGADPETLWQRFCQTTGLPPEASAAPESGNESLGAASAVLMERLNHRLSDLPWPDYSRYVKFGLAKWILTGHRTAEPAIGFTIGRWLRRAADQQQTGLAAAGVRVVGDLSDLEPVPSAGVSPQKVGVEAQLDAALHAIEELLRRDVADDPERSAGGAVDG
ncbi:hypothetical protein JCM18899A_16580 [Nocardioides sp. AN3]